MSRLRSLGWSLLALLAVLLAGPAGAHESDLSAIRVVADKGSTLVSVTAHAHQLAVAEGAPDQKLAPDALEAALRRRLRVRLDGEEFRPGKATVIRDEANDIVMWQAHHPAEAATVEVLARLVPENPQAKTVVTVVRDGKVAQEAFLDAEHPALTAGSGTPESPLVVARRFLWEGVTHIFGGIDHVVFVLGLLLLGGTVGTLLRTVTAFTVAHSITLSLAATGLWTPSPRIVEPLIALSIVFIAVENLIVGRKLRAAQAAEGDAPPLPKRDLRPYLAFGFGLIHGFGFAGALAELGLAREALAVSLITFNAGVELGQAAIVLVVAPPLALLARRQFQAHQWVLRLGSSAIGLAGVYWFVTRLVG